LAKVATFNWKGQKQKQSTSSEKSCNNQPVLNKKSSRNSGNNQPVVTKKTNSDKKTKVVAINRWQKTKVTVTKK